MSNKNLNRYRHLLTPGIDQLNKLNTKQWMVTYKIFINNAAVRSCVRNNTGTRCKLTGLTTRSDNKSIIFYIHLIFSLNFVLFIAFVIQPTCCNICYYMCSRPELITHRIKRKPSFQPMSKFLLQFVSQ